MTRRGEKKEGIPENVSSGKKVCYFKDGCSKAKRLYLERMDNHQQGLK